MNKLTKLLTPILSTVAIATSCVAIASCSCTISYEVNLKWSNTTNKYTHIVNDQVSTLTIKANKSYQFKVNLDGSHPINKFYLASSIDTIDTPSIDYALYSDPTFNDETVAVTQSGDNYTVFSNISASGVFLIDILLSKDTICVPVIEYKA